MKNLFIDIETAPYNAYIWRCFTRFVSHDMLRFLPRDGNIICVCYKWAHEKKVHSIEWNKNGDKELIKKLIPVLNEADHIIAQNGDRFDIPTINTRILAHGLGPVPTWKTIDTLVIARKRFNFPSNRLDALGKFLLSEGKIRTDITWWTDIIENNDPKALARMIKYCKKDVTLLESIYNLIAPFHQPKTHAGAAKGLEKWTCQHCGSESIKKKQTRWTAMGTKQQHMQCKDCHRYYTISDKSFRNWMAERDGGKSNV